MFYPFKLKSIFIQKIWGGENLKRFLTDVPEGDKIGESFEACVRDDYSNMIKNGSYKDTSLKDMIESFGTKIQGENYDNFPLFLKLIDANKKLSVQVHPDDKYAKENEKENNGKDETWVILYSKPGAKIVYGLKEGIGREEFKRAVYDGKVEECLNYQEVKPGDVYNVYPGLVHAIGEGIVVLEIQQNSNTTYRVFDYNRKDDSGNLRQLHIEKALDVIKYKKEYQFDAVPGIKVDLGETGYKKVYINNDYYSLEKYNIVGELKENTSNNKFYIYYITEGKGIIKYNKDDELQIKKGETIFIPAALNEYGLSGSMQFLKMKTSMDKNEFLEQLKLEDVDKREIIKKVVI